MPKSVWLDLKLGLLKPESLHHASDSDVPIIVSMTSFGDRLRLVHKTVRSILSQEHKPQCVVLWLNEQYKDKLPASLRQLEGDKFQVRYSSLDCPHLKLIESLKSFPDAIIVTCDDDLFYQHDFLYLLYQDHKQNPANVIAFECRQAPLTLAEMPAYKRWSFCKTPGVTQENLLALGYAGVLYPPTCLDDRAVDDALFLSLCPKADDLWFKAMQLLKGTAVRKANHIVKPHPMLGSQKVSLKKSNVRGDANSEQWQKTLTELGLAK